MATRFMRWAAGRWGFAVEFTIHIGRWNPLAHAEVFRLASLCPLLSASVRDPDSILRESLAGAVVFAVLVVWRCVDFAVGLECQPREREVDAAGQGLQALPGERAIGGMAEQVPVAAGLLVTERIDVLHECQFLLAMAGNEHRRCR